MGPLRVTLESCRLERPRLEDEAFSLAVGTWGQAYVGDVRFCASFLVSRIAALVSPKIDCSVSFGRVPVIGITRNPSRISVTPDGGYPVLRDLLVSDPSYDSVPLCVGVSKAGRILWDGHRRIETYRSAGRESFPAWIARFVRSR